MARLDRFSARASTGGYLPASDFLAFIENAENGIPARGLFDGRGVLAILVLVFIGGLALNLTPCVLPMIPINLAIIGAGAQAGDDAVMAGDRTSGCRGGPPKGRRRWRWSAR